LDSSAFVVADGVSDGGLGRREITKAVPTVRTERTIPMITLASTLSRNQAALFLNLFENDGRSMKLGSNSLSTQVTPPGYSCGLCSSVGCMGIETSNDESNRPPRGADSSSDDGSRRSG